MKQNKKSWNESLMKAMRAVNFMSGRSVEEAELKNHRRSVERAGKLATPKGSVSITAFSVGNILCEAVKPDFAYNPDYAILYAHGGGYISGGLGYARVLAAKMAAATGLTVISFEYRLAPEYPYPAALTDTSDVWDFLTKDLYRPDHVFIAGDSAGGNLALCLTQKFIKEGLPLPFGLLLFSPWTDMTGTAGSYESNAAQDPVLSKQYIMDAAKAYIGEAGEPGDVRFSPLFGDLSGMPPVFIMAGRNEILLDDSIRLRERIEEAGGRAGLDIEENGWHVYQQMPIPIAKRAMKRLSAYVTGEIYGTDNLKAEFWNDKRELV